MTSWIAAHAVPLVAIAVYLAIIVVHGWQGHRATRGTADYYVGGRTMGGVAVGGSKSPTKAISVSSR